MKRSACRFLAVKLETMQRNFILSLIFLFIIGCTSKNHYVSLINAAIDDNNLGCNYEVQGNYAAAIEYYQKSANQGFYGAKVNLARCYYFGLGVRKDFNYALHLAQQGARYGDSTAQYIIGHALLFGNGIRKNPQNAFYWLQAAANNGHRDARILLDQISQVQWQQYIEQLQKNQEHLLQQRNAVRYSVPRNMPQRPAPRKVTRVPEHMPVPIEDAPDKL